MRTATRTYYQMAVIDAVSAIVSELDVALDLSSLARGASTSPFHFHRIFRGMVGETPLGMRRRILMERAAWQLANTDSAVVEIAIGAGFETHESFTRAFRAAFSTTPSGFRTLRFAHLTLAATCGLHYHPDGIDPSGLVLDQGRSDMNVEIVERPELRLATVRHIGPYNQIGAAFEQLGGTDGVGDLFAFDGAEMIAIYHDDPEVTPLDELASDAAVVVAPDARIPDGLVEMRIPGGKYARYSHIGSFDELGDAWARLMGGWLPDSGYSIGPGGTYEVYVSDMATTVPEEFRTDLYIAVE